MRLRWLVIIAVFNTVLFVASLWQVEYIISCAENGWQYDSPFHLWQSDIWFAHDVWYTVLAIQFAVWVLVSAYSGYKLYKLSKT